MADSNQGPFRLEKFGGLDEINLPVDVGFGGLTEAFDFDADRNGHMRTRQGYAAVFSGAVDAACSDGGMFLFLAGGRLRRANKDGSVEDLGALEGKSLVCKQVGGKMFIHTGTAQAVLSGSALRPLGVPIPTGTDVIVGNGELLAGRYLVACTQVEQDGRESGATALREVEVGDGSAIHVIPQVEPGKLGNVYVSGRNGKEAFFYASGNWVSIAKPPDTLNMNNPLKRQYYGPFPQADRMEWFAGHFWVAAGATLHRSPALDYEVCDLLAAQEFVGNITMLRSVDSGMFVSDSLQTYWLPMSKPSEMQAVWTHNESAIPGSDVPLNMGKVGQGSASGKGCLFATKSGLALGAQDGTVTLLTRRKIEFPDAAKATAMQYKDRYVLNVFAP